MYEIVAGDPALLLALFDEQEIKSQADKYLNEIVAAGMTGYLDKEV